MERFVVELGHEEDELRKIIEPLLDSEGFELVRICLKRAQAKSLLALFVDTAGRKNGVVMENLEFISRFISDVLDAKAEEAGLLRGRYDLEVSSPGVDRPLTKVQHFIDSIGERLKIRLRSPESYGSKSLAGVLEKADEHGIVLAENQVVLYKDILEAHMVFDFSTISKPKKKLN